MYTLHATFDAHVDQEETLAAVLEVLPEGSAASIQREPILLDVTELDKTHIGSSIRGNIGTDEEFGGVLEAAALTPDGRYLTVFVNGVAHSLSVWDAVQVLPPVTEGEHTPDDEVEVEEEFNLSPDNYNDALDLAFQTEQAVANYITAVGWISRTAVEAVAGRVVTDEEYRVVARATREQLTDAITPITGSLVARNLALYQEVYGEAN